LLHLRGKLTRRRQHERAHGMFRGRSRRAGGQPLQHGQRERGGLTGAGLRGGEQIAAGEHDRDGLRLDRRGFGVARVGDRAGEFGRQAELGKSSNDDDLQSGRSCAYANKTQ